jgi:hypothetical protein
MEWMIRQFNSYSYSLPSLVYLTLEPGETYKEEIHTIQNDYEGTYLRPHAGGGAVE